MTFLTFLFSSIISEMNSAMRLCPKKRRKKDGCYSGRKGERTSRLNKTFTDTKGIIFKGQT